MRNVCCVVVLAMSFVWLPTAQAAECASFDYDAPCEEPLNLGKLDIVIKGNWQLDASEQGVKCDGLIPLTLDDVRKYFEQAGSIDSRVANEYITISPCRAYGILTTEKGRQATWNIGMWRDGYVGWLDNPENTGTNVYCGRCQAPFAKPPESGPD